MHGLSCDAVAFIFSAVHDLCVSPEVPVTRRATLFAALAGRPRLDYEPGVARLH